MFSTKKTNYWLENHIFCKKLYHKQVWAHSFKATPTMWLHFHYFFILHLSIEDIK